MSEFNDKVYDVVIMGGGPAGATLASLLKRQTNLSVAIFESEFFPRDHIGESFVHTIVPTLQESGALAKVMASECYVKKAGGYYVWGNQPWVTFFEHQEHVKDGHIRWSVHANRPEFDQILLENARTQGVEVFEGTPVTGVRRWGDITKVTLGDLGTASCRVFVNCSGRTGNTTITGERPFLSKYQNIAVWNHIIGGKSAQTLPGDWNIFRERNLSPIGCFAFDDGWFWYIPVPKVVQGKRVITHSLGLVTDPAALKDPAKRFTDGRIFMETARNVPFLKELVKDAELIADRFLTAPNYSRISGKMCEFDSGEIRVGDAAYFVDPLFSSGVHFALMHASAAVPLIKAYFDGEMPESHKRELWDDYDRVLKGLAHAFALGIDQWYAEIARNKPDSVYWAKRGSMPLMDMRRETFQGLVNGGLHGDLVQVITRGTNNMSSLGKEGALSRTLAQLQRMEPSPTARIRMKSNVAIKSSLTLEGGGYSPDGKPPAFVHGPYWTDPDKYANEVRPLFAEPIPCHRFYFSDGSAVDQVKFVDAMHGGMSIYAELRDQAVEYGSFKEKLTPAQQHVLIHLLLADMLIVEGGQHDKLPAAVD